MNRRAQLVLLWLLATAFVGCGGGNGLPADVVRHLAEAGIPCTPERVHAPWSSRGGYLVMRYSAETATNIIARLRLEAVPLDDPAWLAARRTLDRADGIQEVWGVHGRPAQLRLKNGGQLEHLYLVRTADGLMLLVAEYAYG